MSTSSTSKPSNPSQAEKFKGLARERECDEDQEAFDERLKKVAKAQLPVEQKDR
jgi:hypothetical protein